MLYMTSAERLVAVRLATKAAMIETETKLMDSTNVHGVPLDDLRAIATEKVEELLAEEEEKAASDREDHMAFLREHIPFLQRKIDALKPPRMTATGPIAKRHPDLRPMRNLLQYLEGQLRELELQQREAEREAKYWQAQKQKEAARK